MVGKQENAAKTLMRIEAIILQGLLMGLFLFAMGIALMPFMPFVVMIRRWRAAKSRIALLPVYFVSGCLYAAVAPFGVLVKTIADLRTVVAVEWATRTLEGQPKKPNGQPLRLPTDEERAMIDLAYTIGVIRDYNGEAREYGQGLPIDESRL